MDMLAQCSKPNIGGETTKELDGNGPPPLLAILSLLELVSQLDFPPNPSQNPHHKFVYPTMPNIMVAQGKIVVSMLVSYISILSPTPMQ
jgi:hypothetical protein